MPRRKSRTSPGRPRTPLGFDEVVISAATRDPVDVPKALRRLRLSKTDEERAVALVRMAFDVDAATVMAFLQAMHRIKDDTWRARTIFSALQQASSRFTRDLPAPAQDAIIALVEGIDDERLRSALLRNIPLGDLPSGLRTRLAAFAGALVDPLLRVRTLVVFEPEPGPDRAAQLLDMAARIEDDTDRGEALGTVAPRLDQRLLEDAFTAGLAIADAGVAGRALVIIANGFDDEDRRQRAQSQILTLAPRIDDPIRRFDVLVSLVNLPAASRRDNESTLLGLARRFDDPILRCRALFMTAGYTEDEVARRNALLAGIAAADRVADLRQRQALLDLLRPAGPWLDPAVRAEVRRAVDRIDDPQVQNELRSTLSRMFVRDRPDAAADDRPAPSESRQRAAATGGREMTWDLFVSYATDDLDEARSIAFELQSRGLRVFLAADAIDAAAGSVGWIRALDEAIATTRAMLVLVTDASMASNWVAQEYLKYYRLMVDAGSGCLFSVRLSGPPIGRLPLTLEGYQVIETDGRIAPHHFTRILDLVTSR